jgi:hypothetical protein
MHDDSGILIRRPTSPQGITLDEWLAYVAQSDVVQLVPPTKGVNPFTKQPIEFKPRAGSAFFETPLGQCSIAYKNGTLVVSDAGEEAVPVLKTVASALNAMLEFPKRRTPRGPMSEMMKQLCGTWCHAHMPEMTRTFNSDGTGSAAANGISTPIGWRLDGDRLLVWDASGQSAPGLPSEMNPDREDVVSVDDRTLVVLPWDEDGPMMEMTLHRVK